MNDEHASLASTAAVLQKALHDFTSLRPRFPMQVEMRPHRKFASFQLPEQSAIHPYREPLHVLFAEAQVECRPTGYKIIQLSDDFASLVRGGRPCRKTPPECRLHVLLRVRGHIGHGAPKDRIGVFFLSDGSLVALLCPSPRGGLAGCRGDLGSRIVARLLRFGRGRPPVRYPSCELAKALERPVEGLRAVVRQGSPAHAIRPKL